MSTATGTGSDRGAARGAARSRRRGGRSIKAQLRQSFAVLLLSSLLILLVILFLVYRTQEQYHASVSQIMQSNRLLLQIDEKILKESEDLAFRRRDLESSALAANLSELQGEVALLKTSASSAAGRTQLEVISRTLENIGEDIALLLESVRAAETHDRRVAIILNIRYASEWVSTCLQNYISTEIAHIERINQATQEHIRSVFLLCLLFELAFFAFIIFRYLSIRRSITKPIDELMEKFRQVGRGDFALDTRTGAGNELAVLDHEFGLMARRLDRFMGLEKEKSARLSRMELRLLQEQINPHFLYNTLETIITDVELGQTRATVELVQALSRFFRLSLAGGRGMVPLRDEIDHVRQYLIIQSRRYRDILSFHIEEDARAADAAVPKLILQPIVENAIYHGVKRLRRAGAIVIRTALDPAGSQVEISVLDNGAGMTAARLEQLRRSLSAEGEEGAGRVTEAEAASEQIEDPSVRGEEAAPRRSIGLANIRRRLFLCYGEAGGLYIESAENVGTLVRLRLAARPGQG